MPIRTRVKICCISSADEARLAIELGADALAAIEQVQPFGLDSCSGVRTNGQLDADKLRAFMNQVR